MDTSECKECGMAVRADEYHPYAACLMFKACGNSRTVMANLHAITDDYEFKEAALRARVAELEAQNQELVKSEEKLICERDHWESKATELANDVGQALGIHIGEHSNMNCPVQAAIDGVFEMRSQIEEWQAIDSARCE